MIQSTKAQSESKWVKQLYRQRDQYTKIICISE